MATLQEINLFESPPLGKWIANQGRDGDADLFWAKALLGVRADALLAIGARRSASTSDRMPDPSDEPVETYASVLAHMKEEDPVVAFVQHTFSGALEKSATTLHRTLGTRPSDETMAKLLLLSLHDDGKSQWNVVTPMSTHVKARTMFAAAGELDTLRCAVEDFAASSTSAAYQAAVSKLLVRA